MESVNYVNTFITVAPDSSATEGSVPPERPDPSVAARTLTMIREHPYQHTSGDVIFTIWADRRDMAAAERAEARREFYSKGQACLRSSDLGKRYGWGIHSDADGRVAVYGIDSPEYHAFTAGTSPVDGSPVKVTAAMRSSRR